MEKICTFAPRKKQCMKRIAIVLLALIGTCVGLQAQKQRGDSISLRPSFGVDFSSEVHTDFREGRLANLLQLYADIPSTTICKDFCGLGAKYAFKRAELGAFTDYVRILGFNEWATELICSLPLTDFLTVKPVLHVITSNGETACIGMLRMDISF